MGPKFGQAKTKWTLSIVIVAILLAGIIFVLSPYPKKDSISVNMPNRFTVPIRTGFELQGKNQCSAYSTAFVLRNSGQPAIGLQVYDQLHFKFKFWGYILPTGVMSYLKVKGLEPIIYKGDLASLKQRLAQVNRPILFWLEMVLFGSMFTVR